MNGLYPLAIISQTERKKTTVIPRSATIPRWRRSSHERRPEKNGVQQRIEITDNRINFGPAISSASSRSRLPIHFIEHISLRNPIACEHVSARKNTQPTPTTISVYR